MREVIESIQAAREQVALADVFDDWLTGEIIAGGGEFGR
jgi:hypothetical protein